MDSEQWRAVRLPPAVTSSSRWMVTWKHHIMAVWIVNELRFDAYVGCVKEGTGRTTRRDPGPGCVT